ncbi:MAG: hypothetical protein FWC27_00845 [Firmicutes bacterium]|nr:hypothetical protein [Bacillota bacterium]
MKHMKRLTAVLLAMVLALGILAVPAAAGAEPGYEDALPVVLVHGIFQSEVFLQNAETGEWEKDGEGKRIQAWPPKVDIMALLPPVILPLLASLLLQHDICLTKKLGEAVLTALDGISWKADGMPKQNLQVRRFVDKNGKPMSIKELEDAGDAEGKAYIYRTLPLEEVSKKIGEDKVYFFAYDSLGNHEKITGELLDFIKGVSAKHGNSQVKIIPISLGGTLANSLIDYYYDSDLKTAGPGGKPLLHSVIYVIPALDGSRIAGDVFLKQLGTGNSYGIEGYKDLYRDMFPLLVDGYMGPLINILLRLFPKRMLLNLIDGVLDVLISKLVSYSTTLWSLVPSGDYPKAREMWLMDDAHAEVRRQTDRYYQAQLHSRDNVLEMKADGVHVYDVVEYNELLYSIAGSYKSVNSDTLIQVDSASMGGTAVMPGEALSASYVPQKPYCTIAAHKHYDGDTLANSTLDASTGILPEHTWYFKDANHERTGRNDVVLGLVSMLATADDYVDVHTYEAWPQFNYGRVPGDLKNRINDAKKADTSVFSAEDKAALEAALAKAEKTLASTVVVPGEYEAALAAMDAIMVKTGLRAAPSKPDLTETVLSAVLGFLSEALYYAYGPRGFIDPIWRIWCN